MTSRILVAAAAALLVAAPSLAQQAGSHNPAIKDSSAHGVAAPAKGANSFTRGQATKRLAKAGYTGITGLTKDSDGVWMATATKDGKSVQVGLDYKGNVTVR